MRAAVEPQPGGADTARHGLARALSGALVGVLAAGAAVGVGELVASFVRPAASPVIAVGNRFIVFTPESVKQWAVRTFGTGDKQVLVGGIYLVLALLAMAVGVLALRRLAYGLAGVLAFGVIGCYSALTAPGSQANDVTPSILATGAGLAVLAALARTAGTAERLAEAPPGRVLADRRSFLKGSVATAGLAAIAGFGGRAAQHARFDVAQERAALNLPGGAGPTPAGVDLGKSGVPWLTPNRDFYRVDTALSLPQVSAKSWSLRIHGMVDRELTLTYDQLRARPLIERWITLCCVSNEVGGSLIGNARFLGARLADVLREAGVPAQADQLLMRSADGMTIGAPTAVIMDGRDALLAIGMNGAPLPIAHGYPVRIVVPGLYGYVSACKWVVDIEATTFRAKPAYWVAEGYAAHPAIVLESRIDTPTGGQTLDVGRPVAVAGVAWDQHVGVSKVELQVDDGAWMTARLAAVPSTDTWRQWVVGWTPPAPGTYRLRVRATDGAGRLQTAVAAPPFPAGASGLHTITVRAR